MNFSNQTVIVTGGGTGIGLSIVKAYLDEGANVVICGRREAILEKSVKSLIKIKEEYQDRLFSVKADMSVDKQVINLFKRAKENFSSINILINNAGVWSETPLLKCSSDEIDLIFNNNLKATILGTKIAGATLINGGAIINIGSFAGVLSIRSASLYSTFKAAISHFTKSAASELAERNIRVNCVAPGHVYGAFPNRMKKMDDDWRKLRKKAGPLGTEGTAWDVGWAVVYLASDESEFVTGTLNLIDGGWTL